MVLDTSLGEDPLLIRLLFESNMQNHHHDDIVSVSASGPSATVIQQVTVQDQAALITPGPELHSELLRRQDNNNCGQQVQEASRSASEAARQASQSASQSIRQAQQSASEAARQASQSASQSIQQAQQQASQSIAQASRSASQAASSASSAVASAQSSASSAISRLSGSLDQIRASASSVQVSFVDEKAQRCASTWLSYSDFT